MKMKPSTLAAFVGALIVLVCSGCKTVSMKDINPENRPNARLLPYLKPIVDTNNVQTVYTSGTLTTKTQSNTTGASYTVGSSTRHFGQEANVYSESTNTKSDTTFYSDLRVGDVQSIFAKEVEQNIVDVNTASNPRGRIVLRLNGRASDSNEALELVNGLTVGLLCLFGMPSNFRTEELDINVAIYNNANVLVKQYTVAAADTETTAMYYGYKDEDTLRLAAAQALKNALEEIRGYIYRDYDQIASKL